jgi:hypothetical protein
LIYKPLAWRTFLKELKARGLTIKKTGFDWTVLHNGIPIQTVLRNHPGEDYLKAGSRQELNRKLKAKGIEEI